jgi:hypothetical protein
VYWFLLFFFFSSNITNSLLFVNVFYISYQKRKKWEKCQNWCTDYRKVLVKESLQMDWQTSKHVAVICYRKLPFLSVGLNNLINTWKRVCFTTIQRTVISNLKEITSFRNEVWIVLSHETVIELQHFFKKNGNRIFYFIPSSWNSTILTSRDYVYPCLKGMGMLKLLVILKNSVAWETHTVYKFGRHRTEFQSISNYWHCRARKQIWYI